jgi:hypothetical protein
MEKKKLFIIILEKSYLNSTLDNNKLEANKSGLIDKTTKVNFQPLINDIMILIKKVDKF